MVIVIWMAERVLMMQSWKRVQHAAYWQGFTGQLCCAWNGYHFYSCSEGCFQSQRSKKKVKEGGNFNARSFPRRQVVLLLLNSCRFLLQNLHTDHPFLCSLPLHNCKERKRHHYQLDEWKCCCSSSAHPIATQPNGGNWGVAFP